LSSSRLAWVGALAAMIGGLMWIIKGVSILLTGDQPPVVFEAAMPLFAVGVVGLGARLGELRGPLGMVGVVVACAAAASAVVAFLTELAPFIAIAGFGPFLGLILVGSAALQARIFPSPWNTLPLSIGLGGPVLILAGGGLALINERLLEVPIVIIGLAWVLLGYSVLLERNATFQEARPS
jgi:hypothetical protein